MPMEADSDALPRPPPSPDRESVPAAPTVILPSQDPPRHDAFWATLFQTGSFAMCAAFVLIYFHTSSPKTPIGDTIYSTLRGSTNMLLWETLIAVTVAMNWMNLLRNNVRALVYAMLLAVPVILLTFSLYPLISSFKGAYKGDSTQDRAMRWLSILPAAMAVFWSYTVIRSRHSIAKSTRILEFATKILAGNQYLIFLGFATLAAVVTFTWVWMLMFERIFLSGHLGGSTKHFILDANSWWLAAFFALQYLWTLGVIAGIQRATTAATVSQWYFHRFAVPQPSSLQVVKASFQHALGALFGTVCLSSFLSLLVRLPLIVLPGRVSGVLNLLCSCMVPASLVALTNPLTLTYAAIHSQPLGIAARGVGQLGVIGGTNPSNTLGWQNFGIGNRGRQQLGSTLVPYRLSKLLLSATRYAMSFALGFGSWVRTARTLTLQTPANTGIRGSLYAYVVGLIAATIGFAVLGAVENVVSAVLDAALVCWASETGGGWGGSRGEARFCREAGELFGQEGELEIDRLRGRGLGDV